MSYTYIKKTIIFLFLLLYIAIVVSCNKNIYRVYKHEPFPPNIGHRCFDKIVLFKDSTYKSNHSISDSYDGKHQGKWEFKNDTIKLYYLLDKKVYRNEYIVFKNKAFYGKKKIKRRLIYGKKTIDL